MCEHYPITHNTARYDDYYLVLKLSLKRAKKSVEHSTAAHEIVERVTQLQLASCLPTIPRSPCPCVRVGLLMMDDRGDLLLLSLSLCVSVLLVSLVFF